MTSSSTVFDHPDFDHHEDVVFLSDRDSGLRGIIALHSTRLGPALGGTRFLRYIDAGAALTDALRLSRGMTAKAAIAGLPLGGGKAVIMEHPGADRAAVLLAYASHVQALGGRFVTGEDVGISEADADLIHHGTRYIAGVSNREGGLGDPSPRTAAGVVGAMRAAMGRLHGDRSLDGRRVVVSGVGKVGYALCQLLANQRAEIVVADVAPGAVARVQASLVAAVEVVDPALAHTVEADIFAPCALGAILNPTTIAELRCTAVVGSANNQLATDACAAQLAVHGVLYVPDYVANAGGLIQVAGEWLGFDLGEIERRVAAIEPTVDTVLDLAAARHITPAAAADELVVQRLGGG